MKNSRDKIKNYVLKTEGQWKALPAKRQRLFTKLFFTGYAVLTIMVLISIWISTANKSNTMFIGHISTISDQNAVKKIAKDTINNSTNKK